MKKLFIILFLCTALTSFAQPKKYTTANTHSHNDYEQANPFFEAWQNGFGSIEADIFLQDDQLLVAHETKELSRNRTLQTMYLQPLDSIIQKNNGFPYADKTGQLQLLIDVKTDAVSTLNKLIEVLKSYPAITKCSSLKIAISGNRPAPAKFTSYPSFIYFDGILSNNYSAAELSKIVMLSDDFKSYSLWNASGSLPKKDSVVLNAAINKAHQLKKPVRLWDAPDTEIAWQTFMRLQIDYINTDHIKALADFIHAKK